MKILSRRSFAQGGREGAGVITTRHSLRTNSWTADVAAMVTYLAIPLASWITGQTYPVNGGYTLSL